MGQVEGSYLVARTLKEEGVDTLFYLMGGPNYEIVNNSEDMGIRTVDFRHEQAAAMAAHGYTRVTGKPGVTTAASGPGTLNLLTGQYNAFVDCAPMVTLGGAGPISDFGRGGFQEIDQVSIFEPVSKAVMRPTQADRYPEQVSTAFRLATTGRPGPVYVDCNEDVLYEKVEEGRRAVAAAARDAGPPRSRPRHGPARRGHAVRRPQPHRPRRRRRVLVAGVGRTAPVRGPHRHPLLHDPHLTRPHSGRPPAVIPRRAQRRLPRDRRRPRRGHALQLGYDLRPAHQPERQHHPDRHRTLRNRQEPVREHRPGGRCQSGPRPDKPRTGAGPTSPRYTSRNGSNTCAMQTSPAGNASRRWKTPMRHPSTRCGSAKTYAR